MMLSPLSAVGAEPGVRVTAASDTSQTDGHTTQAGSTDDRRTPAPDALIPDRPFGTPDLAEMKPFDYDRLNAQDYVLTAARITTSITLDGRLDEDAWKLAKPATPFYQLEPREGYPASQPTEVRVLYDNETLYIGAMCFDSDPDKIIARGFKRDVQLWSSDDLIQVALATFEGWREAYLFTTNPNGARRDVFVGQEGGSFDQDWNGNWNAASARHAHGWSTEMAIPFKILRFPARPEQTWGINVGRSIQRNREDSYWVPINRKDGFQGFFKFAKGGRLTGLRDIKPGGAVEVLPFTVLGADGERRVVSGPTVAAPIAATTFRHGVERRFGGDLKWSITSGLTMNATVNPDFAQIEADDQIVNLSRFEFQFPEKRPFFLERSDIFNLGRSNFSGGGGGGGGGGGPGRDIPQLVFSRRIGRLLPDGSTIPIDLGLRLTGKVRKTTVGYLSVQTRETTYEDDDTIQLAPETIWQAVRVQQDILSRSSIGLLATFKEPEQTSNDRASIPLPRFSRQQYNRVLGWDAAFASNRSQHTLQTMLAKSWTDTLKASGQDAIWRVAHSWRNKVMTTSLSYLDIGKNFRAQMGFIPRTDVRRVGGIVTADPLIRKYGLRSVGFFGQADYTANHQDRFSHPESWQVSPWGNVQLEDGTLLAAGWGRSFDTLTEKSEIAGVHFQADEYTFDQVKIFIDTNRGRRLSTNMFGSFGKFYSGRLASVSGEALYKPVDRLSLSLGLTQTRLKRPDRAGLANDEYDYNHSLIPRVRFNYSFTTNLLVNALVQFNADKRRPQDGFHLNTVTSNFLISYRSPYGHSFFLAFNQFSDDAVSTMNFGPYDRAPLRLRGQTIVAKVAYLLNL